MYQQVGNTIFWNISQFWLPHSHIIMIFTWYYQGTRIFCLWRVKDLGIRVWNRFRWGPLKRLHLTLHFPHKLTRGKYRERLKRRTSVCWQSARCPGGILDKHYCPPARASSSLTYHLFTRCFISSGAPCAHARKPATARAQGNSGRCSFSTWAALEVRWQKFHLHNL